VGELSRAFEENGDERVKGMAAWALGRIGGSEARSCLEGFLAGSGGVARSEIEAALEASRATR
jgi:epoxyqueuosine reductase